MLKKCCCCIDLRAGCIIIAILGIIASSGWFAYNSKDDNGSYYVVVSGSVLGLIGNICLLFGAIMTNKIAVAVYLALELIHLVLSFVFSILLFVAAGLGAGSSTSTVSNAASSTFLVAGIMALIILLISIYLWLCVFSFFLKIKREEP